MQYGVYSHGVGRAVEHFLIDELDVFLIVIIPDFAVRVVFSCGSEVDEIAGTCNV
jgi:hypothetical protein